MQDFLRDRSEVFGVDVDTAGLQRFQHDGGIAQPLAVDRATLRSGGRRKDLPQHIGFGEALGADLQHLRRAGCALPSRQQRGDEKCSAAHVAPGDSCPLVA